MFTADGFVPIMPQALAPYLFNNGLVTGQPGFNNPGDWPNVYSFRSRHTAGGNFAFADGSVKFIVEAIDLNLYRNLATHSGGEATGPLP